MYDMVTTNIFCPNCGDSLMTREEPKVIKSNTEAYIYSCPICGFEHVAKSDEDMKEWIKSLDKPIEEEILKETRFCSNLEEAPSKCLNEHCEHAEVFKDKLMCTFYKKWFDLTPVAEDVVNHPSHYETGKFECFDVMREIYGDEAVMNYCICNSFKYMYRFPRKNGIEDVEKAEWYIRHFLQIAKERDAKNE